MKKQKKTSEKRLTNKQVVWLNEYLINGGNAAEAARKAGYKGNDIQLAVRGSENVRKSYIKTILDKKRAELTARADIKAEQLIQEYMKIGFSNIQDYLTDCNNIEDIKRIDRNQAAAVESIQIDVRHDKGKPEGYTERIKLKLYNKLSALDSLGKTIGLFMDNKPNPAAQEERAKRNEKESKAIQELVQTWLNSKYNAIKQVDSVEVPKDDRLSIVGDSGDSGSISGGNNGD